MNISESMRQNKLSFNANRSEMLLICHTRALTELVQLQVVGEPIDRVNGWP